MCPSARVEASRSDEVYLYLARITGKGIEDYPHGGELIHDGNGKHAWAEAGGNDKSNLGGHATRVSDTDGPQKYIN